MLKYVLFVRFTCTASGQVCVRVFFFFTEKTEPLFRLTNDFPLEASKNTVIKPTLFKLLVKVLLLMESNTLTTVALLLCACTRKSWNQNESEINMVKEQLFDLNQKETALWSLTLFV